jgi:hypothetical protein
MRASNYTFLHRSLLRTTTNDVVHLGDWTGLHSSTQTAYSTNKYKQPSPNPMRTCYQRLPIILRHILLAGSLWDILHCYVL